MRGFFFTPHGVDGGSIYGPFMSQLVNSDLDWHSKTLCVDVIVPLRVYRVGGGEGHRGQRVVCILNDHVRMGH